jgi:predicted Zn-ribbon and HTH transcriptional regulator
MFRKEKKMTEHIRNASLSNDEKTRRIAIAVASWLCGTIEGLSNDNADLALAEALDSWLRKQKRNGQILYTGCVSCKSCGHTWESLVSSDDVELHCPQCGNAQKTAPLFSRSDRNKLEK